jgi:hypothetical protein
LKDNLICVTGFFSERAIPVGMSHGGRIKVGSLCHVFGKQRMLEVF